MHTKSRFWKFIHRVFAEPLDEICPFLFGGFHDRTAELAWGPSEEKPSHAESDVSKEA